MLVEFIDWRFVGIIICVLTRLRRPARQNDPEFLRETVCYATINYDNSVFG
jgi:hypothetical protein